MVNLILKRTEIYCTNPKYLHYARHQYCNHQLYQVICNYVMHRFNITITFPRMKQTSIKIELEFHQEIAKRLHPSFHFATSTGSSARPAGLLLTKPAPAWHNDQYHCFGNHGNLSISRAVPVPVQGQARGRLGCC